MHAQVQKRLPFLAVDALTVNGFPHCSQINSTWVFFLGIAFLLYLE